MEQFTIAIPKGRLLGRCLDALVKAELISLPQAEEITQSRQLLWSFANGIRIALVRPGDLPVLVGSFSADLAFAGSDQTTEHNFWVYELADLEWGKCKLVFAARPNLDRPPTRIATKFPFISQQWIKRKGWDTHLIALKGGHEIAPALGLADAIIDLVETGSTLAENGLVSYETIMYSSVRIIVNPMKYKFHKLQLDKIIAKIMAANNAVAENK